MNFTIDGHVSVCCLNRRSTVRMDGRSLIQIWKGPEFDELRRHVASGDLNYDCQTCSEQIEAGNQVGLKAANYGQFAPVNPNFPKVMEFCLDNTCNLACAMCNSVLSSTVRKQRGLPPHQRNYDLGFVDELEPFIPHLQEAVFSGGEPFLIPLYFNIWERMIALNPALTISVVTNGTVLNDRIRDLMERGRFRINISIDSVDPQVYANIRRNADLNDVLVNFEWFSNYGRSKGLRANIPICPLTVNWRGIPDVVKFADLNDVTVNFVHVDRPFSLALSCQSPAYLAEVLAYFHSVELGADSPVQRTNSLRFDGLMEEMGNWATAPADEGTSAGRQWENRILYYDGQGMEGQDDLRMEMVRKLRSVLDHVPSERHAELLRLLCSFPVPRLQQFMNGRPIEELVVMFNEFAGE